MEVTWIGHATVLIEMNGTRVVTDPLLGRCVGPLLRVAPAPDLNAFRDVDAVLLSHLHADHAQPWSLRRAAAGATVVAPRGAGTWLRRKGISNVREIAAGEEVDVGALTVHAVPAAHERQRRPLGPEADPIGFVVRGSHGVYFAGDTDIFGGMADLSVDLALLPVWGWGPNLGPGHLDPAGAARAAALIAPRVAIPIHWGTFALPGRLAGRAATDEPAREFVDLARREAPGVEVRVLYPGQRTTLG